MHRFFGQRADNFEQSRPPVVAPVPRCGRPDIRVPPNAQVDKAMKIQVTIAVLAALAAASTGAQADVVGNAKAGAGKVAACIGCHGIPDYRTAYPEVYRVPKLGGQNARYLETALQEYKKGDRKFQTMHANAASLSDQDIADIAAYYAAQTPATQNNPNK
ncbi:protein of unknown function [Pararobbsia alpina]